MHILSECNLASKHFDMVFVFKDFARAPYHINTIPVEFLDQVKDFLDSSDIAYSEGPLNLNWPTIMKTVTADTHQFFVDGGWGFLQENSDDENGEEESEEESAFEMDDDEMDEVSESSEEGSDFGSNASDDDDDDAELDSEDEGEDWDEMEKKAKKRDRESALDDEDRGGKKKQRKR